MTSLDASAGRHNRPMAAYELAKRAFDALVALLALLVLGPVMLVIALAVRLESPGPAIFRQRRAGWRGRPFEIWKFRTMRADADAYGNSPHGAEDPRLTAVSRRLRETSLDELPQLLNVLAGRMSFVGPRPLYERQAEHWDERQRRRLDVRPGITGYAQAYGRGTVTIEEKIDMDLHYVDNLSIGMDVKIIWRTICNVFRRRGDVYESRYSRDKEYEDD